MLMTANKLLILFLKVFLLQSYIADSQFEKQLLSDNLEDYDNIRIEYTDSLINLKNLIIDSYDRYFNRKTRFNSEPIKHGDDYLLTHII